MFNLHSLTKAAGEAVLTDIQVLEGSRRRRDGVAERHAAEAVVARDHGVDVRAERAHLALELVAAEVYRPTLFLPHARRHRAHQPVVGQTQVCAGGVAQRRGNRTRGALVVEPRRERPANAAQAALARLEPL